MLKIKSKEELEMLVESYMKEAYKEEDYLRSYNLLKLLVKINPDNKSAAYYANLLTPSLLKKTKRKWLWYSLFKNILLKPKTYFYLGIVILLNKLK